VLYESPHRVLKTLEVMAEIFPNRPLALCRELTKMHEEIVRGTVQQILDNLRARPTIKGEITLVLGPMEARSQTPQQGESL